MEDKGEKERRDVYSYMKIQHWLLERIIRCFPCFRLASKAYSRYTDFSKVREIAWVLNHCVQY